MIYRIQGSLLLRTLEERDCGAFPQGFLAQGWHKPESQFQAYLQEQEAGLRQVLVAQYAGEPAGYVTLLPQAHAGPFAGTGYPELVDFNVLQAFQRRGIGTALLEQAEALAVFLAPVLTLGVGLHRGYGQAQRLYIRRGYQFDGTGLWYQNASLPEGAPCCNDDDLVLYLSKKLS